MLAALEKQLKITIKDDLKKDYDDKIKSIRNEYEKQFQILK